MKFEEYKKDVEIVAQVRKKKFSFAQVKSVPAFSDKIFAVITDGNEITMVAEEDHGLEVLSEEKDLRIISFETKITFDLIGFLSYITKLLADQDISLFALSSFSTDHILMSDQVLDHAIRILKDAKVKIVYR